MFSGELSLPKSGLTEGRAVQIECIQDDGQMTAIRSYVTSPLHRHNHESRVTLHDVAMRHFIRIVPAKNGSGNAEPL